MIIRVYALDEIVFGGSFFDYFMDIRWDPVLVIGQYYIPNTQKNQSWSAFTASQFSLDALERRKTHIRSQIFDIYRYFSVGTFKQMLILANHSDGQLAHLEWEKCFFDHDHTNLDTRSTELRALRVKGTENPSKLMLEVLQGFNILSSANSTQYSLEWVLSTLLKLISENSYYRNFRENNLVTSSSVLLCTTVNDGMHTILAFWEANSPAWITAEKKKKKDEKERKEAAAKPSWKANAAQKGGPKGAKGTKGAKGQKGSKGAKGAKGGKNGKNGKKGGKSQSMYCSTCQGTDHEFVNCLENQCYTCWKWGHISPNCPTLNQQWQSRSSGYQPYPGKGGGKGGWPPQPIEQGWDSRSSQLTLLPAHNAHMPPPAPRIVELPPDQTQQVRYGVISDQTQPQVQLPTALPRSHGFQW